jgi:biopolymer transport protein ExbD
MAHIDDGKGQKSANVELNIVPVIDLMSVLIVFLLITAVWNQITMIQLGTSVYGKKTNDETETPKPKNLEVPLRLDIQKGGYVVVIGSTRIPIPLKNGDYDQEFLGDELAKIKERYPEKEDIFLTVADELEYDSMVKGMDVAISEGFPNIAVTTQAANDGGI